jgi:biopolymer transport protein ExbB/TolQ
MLTKKLMDLVIVGGSEWVMVLLIILSIISVGVVIERWLFLSRRRRALDRLDRKLSALLLRDDAKAMKDLLAKEEDQPALQLAVAGLGAGADRESVEKKVSSALSREQLLMERRLGFLGTLGNNAPFIGLFGTVLGIIRAFHDLAVVGRPDTNVVMAGISEALVATAIGLFVALPAVLFYNYFQRHMDRTLSITEALAQGILACIPGQAHQEAAPQKEG